jgi:hypothetical protein
MEPTFAVGDEVEFELDSDNLPRWNYGVDSGATGKWGKGKVDNVSEAYVSVRGSFGSWGWPLKGHYTYNPSQWSKPGWLRKVGATVKASVATLSTQEPPCRCKGPVGIHDGNCEYLKWNQKRLAKLCR